jgi:hypothetical protein
VICSRLTVKLEDNTECELKLRDIESLSEDGPRDRKPDADQSDADKTPDQI